MKIEALNKSWDIRDISYKQRRELHAINAEVWWKGEMDVGRYYDLLAKVSDIAGIDESVLADLEMTEVDALLQACFMAYLGLTEKKSKP
jgi:hypothetical protein